MTLVEFIEMHSLGAIFAVLTGAAVAWVIADRGGF